MKRGKQFIKRYSEVMKRLKEQFFTNCFNFVRLSHLKGSMGQKFT